jgi:hypothetical protein
MNETLSGLGLWGAAIASLLTGAATWWLTRAKREASDRAEMESDQARGDTYEMLRRENDALLERARQAEQRATAAERELVRKGDALLTMQRLLRIGATNDQLAHYFAESGLAPLDDGGPR